MNSKKISLLAWEKLKRDPELKSDLVLVGRIAGAVKHKGGRAFLVGGFVRDLLMGRRSKDLDVEVHGLDLKTLKRILTSSFQLPASKFVGKSFGVFKIGDVDVALARKDSKTAPGQGRKTQVLFDPTLTLDKASRRRDLTINALYLDPLTREVLDPQGGLKDLKHKILRHVDAKRFGDDPLRVVRLMQFAGRFGFKIHQDTVKLCRRINLKRLSKERIGEEWNKLLLKSPKPSPGLKAAKELGILKQLHPALERLSARAWRSALLSIDRHSLLATRYSPRTPTTTNSEKRTAESELRYASLCYWLKDKVKIKKFLEQVDYPKSRRSSVLALIDAVRGLKKHCSDYELRKTAFDLNRHRLHMADAATLAGALGMPALAKKINRRASQLKILASAPVPFVQGRDLIKLGLKPGPHFAQLLKRAMEAQWRGEIKHKREALKYAIFV